MASRAEKLAPKRLIARRTRANQPTGLETQEWGAAALFLLPNVVGFLAFTALPVLAALGLSFLDWDFMLGAKFAGLENYRKLILEDATFHQVLGNTAYYVGVNVPANIVLALLMALALNQGLRGTVFFRTVYFLPVVTTMVAVALIWRWMYNTEYGVINYVLDLAGFGKIPWLTSTEWPMLAIIIMSVWKGAGYNMVIFLAGLQGIPQHLYEAASIDGAGAWRRFLHITLPLLSPTTFFVLVITIINSFQVFEQALVMTEGGPANATNTIVLFIYQNGFQYYMMGYAAAIAWILFAIIFVFTVIQSRLQQQWVHYE